MLTISETACQQAWNYKITYYWVSVKIVSPIQQTANMSEKSIRVDIGKRYKPYAST